MFANADSETQFQINKPPLEEPKRPGAVTVAKLTREPEFIEKFFLYLERKNIFQSVSISVKISSFSSLTPNLAFWSCRRLILKYPLLFSFPLGQEPNITWQPLPEIRFEDVFYINDVVTEPFDSENAQTRLLNCVSIAERHQQRKPLWKLVYYSKTNWLTLHCAHSFTDGGSIIAYLKEFVEGLNDQTSEAPNEPDLLFSLKQDQHLLTHGISPAFFERVHFHPSFGTFILIVLLKLAIGMFPVIIPTLLDTHLQNSGFVGRHPVPYSTRSFFESDFVISEHSPLNDITPMFINIPPEVLETMIGSCRAHQVKLQTYLVCVYVHTIHELHPDLYFWKFLKIGVPVSLRNVYKSLSCHNTYLGDTGRFDDGFYSLSVKYFINPREMFSWTSVKKYHDFLHNTVNSAEWINRYYVAARTMTAECYMSQRVEFKKDDCFLISTNLGQVEVLDHGNSGRFQIEDILFAPSSGSVIGTHHMTVCSTRKSGLNIGFSDGDKNIEDWKLFKRRLKENLVGLHQQS